MDIVEQLRAAPENGAYLDIFLDAASEIERLRAENESLASNLRGKHATTGATYAHLIAERDRLRDENAKLRVDAERLDWIQKNARCDPKMDGHHVWWPTSFNKTVKGSTIRAAIDAAMREGK